jgi:hypothetical protein
VFWRWTGARDTLVAAACSGDGAETEPTKFNHAEMAAAREVVGRGADRPLRRRELRTACRDGPGGWAQAPVRRISISAEAGLKSTREELKEWVPAVHGAGRGPRGTARNA